MSDKDDESPSLLPESLGGSGGPSVRDVRLLKRAVRECWDVPEAVFRALPNVAARYAIGLDKAGDRLIDPRTGKPLSLAGQFAAMKILLDMMKQNVDTARLELDASRMDERDR